MDQKEIEIINNVINLSPNFYNVEKYLEAIKFNDLVMVAKVMYGGRDYLRDGQNRNLDDFMDYLYRSDKVGLIDSISGKAPLAKYLQAGLVCFSMDSVSRAAEFQEERLSA
jgi:hypothetical protein